MAADYVQIAATLAAYLAPFTPYLIEGGKKFAGETGKAAWEKSQELWKKIKTRFEDDKDITEAAQAVAINPENEGFQSLLAKALAARLNESPEFADELLALIGGQEAVQKIKADKSSWIENVTQEIIGGGNANQVIEASDDSVVTGVRQSVKR
ncbi:MAG: hypothetical protein ABIG63_18910 [Chloroflexota bacterium]